MDMYKKEDKIDLHLPAFSLQNTMWWYMVSCDKDEFAA
jgi:hypothetical protein